MRFRKCFTSLPPPNFSPRLENMLAVARVNLENLRH